MKNETTTWEPFNPIHIRLIGLPFVLFLVALLIDIGYSISPNPALRPVAFLVISAGIPIGLLNALSGLLRWVTFPADTRGAKNALSYGVLNLALMLLFTLSWLLRRGTIDPVASGLVFALSYGGMLLGVFSLWLGSEIVYGVDGDTPGYRHSAQPIRLHPNLHEKTGGIKGR